MEIAKSEEITQSSSDLKSIEKPTSQRIQKVLSSYRGRPLHDIQHTSSRLSLFSHRAKHLDLKGFYNLFVIILLVTNARMVIKNLLKYGWMITIPLGAGDIVTNWPVLFCFIKMHSCIIQAWIIERFVASHSVKPTHPILAFLQILNFTLVLVVPLQTVIHYKPDPVLSILLLAFSIVWLFKFLSFHHLCYDVRRAIYEGKTMMEVCENEKEAELASRYPQTVNFMHFYRFILMPTMCFQFYYPSTSGIRWLSVLRHIFESLVCMAIMKIIFEQYIVVILKNTFTISDSKPIRFSTFLFHLVERVLKLSIPNLYFWLLMFMVLFHHWCNILAEITYFGDRLFYEDWWNASSFGEYWRKWNLPIHYFLNRHVNKPLLRRKIPKGLAGIIVFSISALLHEYLVVVPLQLGWTGYVFWAFMAQVPLMKLTNLTFFQNHKIIGNIFFWIVFCFTGQPLGILLYFYLYGVKIGNFKSFNSEEIGFL